MKGISISPKFGVNPTLGVCFWCGEENGEIAMLGRIGNKSRNEDLEAPKHMVLGYEPCDKCKKNMDIGFTVMEATSKPNSATSVEMQNGVYPTGRYVVLKNEAAQRLFDGIDTSLRKAFVDTELFAQIFANG